MADYQNFTQVNLAPIINEVWVPEVQREWQADLLFANWLKDLSGRFAGGGDIANISGIYTNQLSANDKGSGDEVTLQSATGDSVTLTIDTWKEISFIFEDLEAQLVLQDAETAMEYADQARYILRKTFETAIATALNSGITAEVGSSSDNLTDGLVREAIEKLDASDVDMDQVAFFFHPTTYWHDLQGVSKYYQYDQSSKVWKGNYGAMNPSLLLYDLPVFKTSVVPKSTEINNFLIHKSALAHAIRTPGGGVRSQASYEILKLGTVWVSDLIYGMTALRTDAGVVLTSNTGAIVS